MNSMKSVANEATVLNGSSENSDRNTSEYFSSAEPAFGTTDSKQSLSAYLTIAASAIGLISDGYQNNLMTMTNVVFTKLYPDYYTSIIATRVSNAILIGDIVGQLLVGLICDRVGRKAALIITSCMIIIGASIGTAAHGASGSVLGLFWCLTFARGITGVGVGGEYPAASTSASEAANEKTLKWRGPVIIMVTNFVLVIGGPLAVTIFLIVLSGLGEDHLTSVWRVCFGIGILLPTAVFALRWGMLSTKLFKKGAIKRQVPYLLVLRYYWKSLIGTCGAWFLFDFVWYPNGIFSASIISSVIKDGDIKRTAEWQLLLGTLTIPGVFAGALLCNLLGRRYTMMLGFGGYIILGLIIGLAYDEITRIVPLFVVLYGLMQSFGNLGPGDMSIVVSAESFATPVRGTCFGVSAALGKLGAVVGTQVFTPIQNHFGKRWTFIVAAICGIGGIIVTYFFVSDMTGVDLAEEDAAFMEYLSENGWEGKVGEGNECRLVIKEGINRRGSRNNLEEKGGKDV